METIDKGNSTSVIDKLLQSVDETVQFPPATAAESSITLASGHSQKIMIRGLQFFDGDHEVYSHLVP